MIRRMLVLVVTALVAALALPVCVSAGPSVLLGFAENYTGPDGASRTHRGLDVALDAGADVVTPLGGEVSFVGRVPGPEGGTVLAATIADGDRRLTFMPLAAADVQRGDRVEQGAQIGTVADFGDPSSDRVHLHVGLRQGDVYVDPAGLFVTAAAVPSPEPVEVPSTAEAVNGAEAGAAVAHGALSASGVAIGGGAPVVGGAGVSAPAGAGSAAGASSAQGMQATLAEPGVAPAVSGELANGVSLASPGPADTVRIASGPSLAPATVGQAARSAGGSLLKAVSTIVEAPLGVAACAVAALGCALLFTRRALVRRLVGEEPMSGRLGSMLRALRTGDTISGFTSCSGHSAFTDPGPL